MWVTGVQTCALPIYKKSIVTCILPMKLHFLDNLYRLEGVACSTDHGWLRISNRPTGPFVSASLALAVDRTGQLISDRDIESVYVLVKDTHRSISFNNFSLNARLIKMKTRRSSSPCSTLVSLISPAACLYPRLGASRLMIGSCVFYFKRRTAVPGKLIHRFKIGRAHV